VNKAHPVRGVGIGLRVPHYRQLLEERPAVGWLEVHTENYLARSGWDWHVLQTLRRDYPVSLHGVGLGLGSVHGFSEDHLERVRQLAGAIEPALVSEHLSWGALRDRQLNDLLPLRLDRGAGLVAARVERVQEVLKRRILVENVSTYLRFAGDAMSEAEFLAALARRTGCGILLDVNNLYVNQCNHGEDALAALDALASLAPGTIAELHLGGHLVTDPCRHRPPRRPHRAACVGAVPRGAGALRQVPSLIEWDTDVPALEVLLDEARRRSALPPRRRQPRRRAAPASPRVTCRQPPPADGRALAELQQAFGAALADPAGLPLLAPQLKGEAGRLGIYRGNLASALARALAKPIPCCASGWAASLRRPRARLRTRPPGAGPGPEPLRRRAGRFSRTATRCPWLPELARLEWSVHEVLVRARCAGACRWRPAAGAGEPEPAAVRGQPRRSCIPRCACTLRAGRRPRCGWPNSPMAGRCPRLGRPAHVLILRARWQVAVRKIDAAEHAALARLAAGKRFGAAFDAAFDLDEDAPIAAWLDGWLKNGGGDGDREGEPGSRPARGVRQGRHGRDGPDVRSVVVEGAQDAFFAGLVVVQFVGSPGGFDHPGQLFLLETDQFFVGRIQRHRQLGARTLIHETGVVVGVLEQFFRVFDDETQVADEPLLRHGAWVWGFHLPHL
jgi:uncharacterized protein (UPF0276 family)